MDPALEKVYQDHTAGVDLDCRPGMLEYVIRKFSKTEKSDADRMHF